MKLTKLGADVIGRRKSRAIPIARQRIIAKRTIIAFDRDDTVSTGKGPVPIQLIRKMKQRGYKIFAIGNQRLVEEAGILSGAKGKLKEYIPARERKRRLLLRLKKSFPMHARFIVVDNLKIEAEGWHYMSPEEFLELFEN